MKRINVVGCGRVGTTLAFLFQQHGVGVIQDLHSRRAAAAEEAAVFIGAGRPVAQLQAMRPADIWLLSVPDSQVTSIADRLCVHAPQDATTTTAPIAFHCSGFLPASSLQSLRTLGWQIASVHPVFNFADPARGVLKFQDVPCGLEGDESAVFELTSMLTAVGGQCFPVRTDSKAMYHAAAVFSSNFTVVLQAIGREAWRQAGVPEALIPLIHESLLRGTIDNVLALSPAAAITGPAARGDTAVVEAQGALVAQWHPEASVIYSAMSALARRLSQTGSTMLLNGVTEAR